MTTSDPSGLRVQHLAKSYPDRAGDRQVLVDVTFELAPGDSLAVLGPSGSGKSTLLNCIGALDTPTCGSIHVHGKSPVAQNEAGRSSFRRMHIGFVFQEHHLLPACTALENVLLPTLGGDPLADAEGRARALLGQVGLAERANAFPDELSGGERQRVAVARALIRQPSLLLCDEPTGSLDRENEGVVADLFLRLVKELGLMLILVTHNERLAKRFDRQADLVDGRLLLRSRDSS